MCYMFGNQNLIFGRSPQVVKTKNARSAVVISFQVVSRRDGCSKVHSRRIWYSIFEYKNLYFWGPPPGDGGGGRIFQQHQPPTSSRTRIPYPVRITPHSDVCIKNIDYQILREWTLEQPSRRATTLKLIATALRVSLVFTTWGNRNKKVLV